MPRTTTVLALGALGVAAMLGARSRQTRPAFTGQTVLITGGSRGLGLALAREFARQGARVALCARDPERLARAEADLRGRGADVFTRTADVADREAIAAVVDEVSRRFGGIDVLVTSAGIIQVGPIEDMTAVDFEEAMAVNFWGTVHATLAALPGMRARGRGRIVNITSIGGKVSVPHLLPYCAAKFAAVAFSEGLRVELAGTGLDVVTVVPGLMRTGSYRHALVKGNVMAESRWFALGASAPLLSMAPDRAARHIVEAARRGDPERILSLPAVLLARLHGVAPAFTGRLLAASGRWLLPRPIRRGLGPVRAVALEPRWSRWVRAATTLGRLAARDLNQASPSSSLPRRPAA